MTSLSRSAVFDQLTSIVRDVFDDDSIVLTDQTTAKDIPQWDSLNHINLVIRAEQAFNLKFSTAQVANMANVGEFVNTILNKLANPSS